MFRVGIIILITILSVTAVTPPPYYRSGPDTTVMDRISQMLRKQGPIIRGPLTLPDIPQGASHLDDGLLPPLVDSYNFYLPQFNYDEKPMMYKDLLTEFAPPKITNEPNYYTRKQRKFPKKYSSTLKQVNIKSVSPKVRKPINTILPPKEPEIMFDEDYFKTSVQMQAPASVLLPPMFPTKDTKVEESIKVGNTATPDTDTAPQKENAGEGDARVEYQVHGFDGPKSYKFGFDTGKGKDRQFRFEERDKTGEVKGQYGYEDNDGKVTVVKYTSSAEKGFQVEKSE